MVFSAPSYYTQYFVSKLISLAISQLMLYCMLYGPLLWFLHHRSGEEDKFWELKLKRSWINKMGRHFLLLSSQSWGKMPVPRSFLAKSWHCCPLAHSHPKTTSPPLCVWRKHWEGLSAWNIWYGWSCAPFSIPHVHCFLFLANGLYFKITFFWGVCTWRNWEIQAHRHGFYFEPTS